MSTRRQPSQTMQRGFSLVELLVAVTIGLVVSLAIFTVLTTNEARKRTQLSVNDTSQTGAFLTYAFERAVRNAGSGYGSELGRIGGCRLNVNRGATVLLPRATAWPGAFLAVTGTLRLAPVVIIQDASSAGSDVLVTMEGTAGFGDIPVPLSGPPTATSLNLINTIGLNGNDLVLITDGNECLLEQVTAPFVGGAAVSLPLSGTYYTAAGANQALTAFTSPASTYVFALGNAAVNRPQMRMFGVGDNETLFSLDIFDIANNDTPTPVAEGVVEMRALYGVDNVGGDGKLDNWVDPSGASWGSAALLDGSSAARIRLSQIVAVRVGLILRTSLPEKLNSDGNPVAPPTLALFSDLPAPLKKTRTLTTDERNLRHRIVETIVPVRNAVLPTLPVTP